MEAPLSRARDPPAHDSRRRLGPGDLADFLLSFSSTKPVSRSPYPPPPQSPIPQPRLRDFDLSITHNRYGSSTHCQQSEHIFPACHWPSPAHPHASLQKSWSRHGKSLAIHGGGEHAVNRRAAERRARRATQRRARRVTRRAAWRAGAPAHSADFTPRTQLLVARSPSHPLSLSLSLSPSLPLSLNPTPSHLR